MVCLGTKAYTSSVNEILLREIFSSRRFFGMIIEVVWPWFQIAMQIKAQSNSSGHFDAVMQYTTVKEGKSEREASQLNRICGRDLDPLDRRQLCT